jgi:spermidine synthase
MLARMASPGAATRPRPRLVGSVAALCSLMMLGMLWLGSPAQRKPRVTHPKEVVLYEGDSAYGHRIVTQGGTIRCLQFGPLGRQTCIDVTDPDRQVFDYSTKMFVGFLLRPQTRRVAMLGLGGGVIARTFARQLPSTTLAVAEVDPLVVRLAHDYFALPQAANLQLAVDDGRQFLRQSQQPFDQILMDAYRGDSIPAHLTTREFLLEARAKLTPGGLMVANLWLGTELFPAEMATYRSVFRSVRAFRSYSNAIIVASDGELPATRAELEQLQRPSIKGVDFSHVAESLLDVKVSRAPILTDDYVPANLLLQQRTAADAPPR